MKIGLFFGSFNPVHIGHMVIARSLVNQSDLEQVWFVVSPQNPFKERASLAHEFDRYDMVRRACHDSSDLWASDIEFSMPKPSYTVDTLTYMREKYPEHQFSIIMGQDNLLHLKKWKNWEALVSNHEVYVYPRPGVDTPPEIAQAQIHEVTDCPIMELSASSIRSLVAQEKSIEFLVPKEVQEFIESKGLYK